MDVYILIAAILPAVILTYYIYRRDKFQHEPIREILKGFGWGVLSALITLAIVAPIPLPEQTTVWGCFAQSFIGAAIPEECCKALCLYLFLRKNKHFDEYMDGIVYAVCIGMGFAALENILYLFDNIETWLFVGIARGLISIPGHFAFAVAMGYFYSLWHIEKKQKYLWLMLIVPIIAHGLFDFIQFLQAISGALSIALTILFFTLLHYLRKHCSHLIEQHLKQDETIKLITELTNEQIINDGTETI